MMTGFFGLNRHVTEEIFNAAGEEALPLLDQLRISVHLFFCPRCAEEARKLELLREVMKEDFFPPVSDFSGRIMARINAEDEENPALSGAFSQSTGSFSIRSWIITGCFLILSLATVFFGLDFISVANDQGSSFMLPVGITIGSILTGYLALFIGSHLKELSSRFRLRQ